ncbi:MAG: AraC family transcriptional regulator ligand-binding domain-containing protein [Pseudomonadota bacterium]
MNDCTQKYPIATNVRKFCAVLNIEPKHVLRRAGLPADYLDNEGRGVSASQIFALWEAGVAEAKRPDMALFLGKALAHGPFIPSMFAFSCSPSIEIGLTRLALFKPLVGPLELILKRSEHSLEVGFAPTDRTIRMPGTLAAFELVYLIESCRAFAVEHIVPLSIGIPELQANQADLDAFFGVAAHVSDSPTIVLSSEDAERPLISESAEMWAGFEKDLQRQLAERDIVKPMAVRVRNVLLELLPAGLSSAEDVCDRLHVSKRSLQRHLKNEGASFQSILDETRSELSLHYLSQHDLTIPEISYLLAYRDPNSFYRAFNAWTGMTPSQARGQRLH